MFYMYCILKKTCFDNIFFLLLDSRNKMNKDDIMCRKDLAIYCSCKELEVISNRGRVYIVKTTYSLVRNDVELVCEWLKRIKFLDRYVSKFGNWVNIAECTITWLKSHDCHALMQIVRSVVFCDLIPLGLWNSLTELSYFFKDIFALIVGVECMIRCGRRYSHDIVQIRENISSKFFFPIW